MIAPDEMIDGNPPASHVLTTGSAPQSPGPSPQHPPGEGSVSSGGSLARPVQKMKSLTIKPKFLPRTTGIAALLTSLHLIAASGETYAYSPVMSTLFPNNLPWNARSNATTALKTGSCSTVAPAWVSSSCSVLVSSDQVSDLCRSAHVLEQNGDLRPFNQLQHGLHTLHVSSETLQDAEIQNSISEKVLYCFNYLNPQLSAVETSLNSLPGAAAVSLRQATLACFPLAAPTTTLVIPVSCGAFSSLQHSGKLWILEKFELFFNFLDGFSPNGSVLPPDMENKPLSEQSKAVFSVISSRTCSSTDKFLAPELNEKFKAFLGILQQKLPVGSPSPPSWFFSTLSCFGCPSSCAGPVSTQSSEAIVPELNESGATAAGMTIVPIYIGIISAGHALNPTALGHINDVDHLVLSKADPNDVDLLLLPAYSFSERLEKLYVSKIDLPAAKLLKMIPGNINPAIGMPLLLPICSLHTLSMSAGPEHSHATCYVSDKTGLGHPSLEMVTVRNHGHLSQGQRNILESVPLTWLYIWLHANDCHHAYLCSLRR